MSKNQSAPAKSATPASAAATPAPKLATVTDLKPGQALTKTGKVKRVMNRYISAAMPGFVAHVWADVVLKHGTPKDPKGNDMVIGDAPRTGFGPGGGVSAEERAKRTAEKEAEKARIAAMSDEEKLAYAKTQREAKAKAKDAKKQAEKEALLKQVRAEMAADFKAGKLKL